MMSYLEILRLAAPEGILVLTALAVLGVDVGVTRTEPRASRLFITNALALFGCVVAFIWMLPGGHPGTVGGLFTVTPLTQLVKQALVVLSVLTLLLSVETSFSEHLGEYVALVLLATVGMMLVVSAEDTLMIFVALELTSLSLYTLTAFNKADPQSAEAALKYFLFGSVAAAFALFGLSLLYGATGATALPTIAAKLHGHALTPLLAVALVMIVIGFGFKVAAVPFHLWAPDAYQGAPVPVAALIASGSKVAGFFILAKVMMLGFAGLEGSGSWGQYAPGWIPLLAVLAVASMLLGNLAALAQTNVKRLLAYSAIAHGGYVLLGVMANTPQGVAAVVYYAMTYGLTVIGAFGVVAVVEARTGSCRIADFAGLGKRSPLLAGALLIFLLSLAGIPPLAGFFGKFYVFAAAANGAKELGLLWTVVVALAMSTVSLYYYLKVLKQVYVLAAPDGAGEIKMSLVTRLVLVAMAAAVVLLGALPDLILDRLVPALAGVVAGH